MPEPLSISRRVFVALHLLASAHFDCRQYDRALTYARFLLRCDPDHCAVRRLAAAAELELGRPEAALHEVDHALPVSRNSSERAAILLLRARILQLMNRVVEAEEAAEAAMALTRMNRG